MSWGFEAGRVYSRSKDIHARFKGQPRPGIITPRDHAVVFIVSGKGGETHGYDDRWRKDGVFEYFGMGRTGDMEMASGNLAIRDHSKNGKSLLLFMEEKKGAGLRFEGEMVYETHHIRRAPDTNKRLRNAIVFELRRIEAVVEATEGEVERSDVGSLSLAELRLRAIEAAGEVPPRRVAGFRNVYQRSAMVREYILARANGHCEGCDSAAPFTRPNGSPYLEPHHIRRVSDGGPDHPAFVIALCPNCHRRVHAGSDGSEYNASLLARMDDLEPKV